LGTEHSNFRGQPRIKYLQDARFAGQIPPPQHVVFAPMKVLVSPALAGFNAVRHLAWYLGYHTAGSRHDLTR
jgi:hypothetical protein